MTMLISFMAKLLRKMMQGDDLKQSFTLNKIYSYIVSKRKVLKAQSDAGIFVKFYVALKKISAWDTQYS